MKIFRLASNSGRLHWTSTALFAHLAQSIWFIMITVELYVKRFTAAGVIQLRNIEGVGVQYPSTFFDAVANKKVSRIITTF